MTSNLGSHLIQENFEKITEMNVDEVVSQTKEEVFSLLKQTLRPEFLNRIDETVLFQPLNKKEIGKIVMYQLRGFNEMLAKRGILMTATDDAVAYITNKGYDPSFGARPLKRVLQQEVLNKLSKEILAGTVDDGEGNPNGLSKAVIGSLFFNPSAILKNPLVCSNEIKITLINISFFILWIKK